MTRTGPTLTFEGLSKSFGQVRAVDDLSFTVRPGAVTGFLGPNGSGKTTTLRMLLGLTTPSAGRALVDGTPYVALPRPARVVGASLEAGFHPARTGLGHLEVFAPQVGVSRQRCRDLLDLVGLTAAAQRRVGGYSMGMRQRLALATTLLGDPPAIVLDEPANGLDPEGIVWLRGLLRTFAAEGRTVLVSSHVLGEVQHTVDDVVIIAGGRLVHASSLADLADLATQETLVVSPDAERLAGLCRERGWRASPEGAGLVVSDVSAAVLGAAAFAAGVELHQLATRGTDLEEVFLRLTAPAPGPVDRGLEVAR
ncbi:ATP-binding cassette domain-containing protein [Nocardioides sp. dk4132]|uniref:ATP-binding cassette domain-containing protein n=1 Tax=unclassified Nocardioides TaxID=2615069 RepID=UPI001296EA20|nr:MULTISPECIES: ATP-binding cassette domain-containing protein [unclassified Nocardioides]MQW76031.1 ATP-binding cassette domain-containing protein [Nocardioides sp. dk4132]QGA08882.1 ATP-binding cassette domain-containing protein [Nocardioides sp. dk884]